MGEAGQIAAPARLAMRRIAGRSKTPRNDVIGVKKHAPKTFDDACEQLAKEISDLVIKKQHDYGKDNILKYEDFMKQVLGRDYRVGVGVLARLNDKMERLKNLYAKGEEPKNESIDDTFRDIIGYALVALLLLRNQFKLPLK